MHFIPSPFRSLAALTVYGLIGSSSLLAATRMWDGGGPNSNWTTARNWDGDNLPVANDLLVFDGFARLTPTNDFAAGTPFGPIDFAATAGAFTLTGNGITLHGDIIDDTAVLTQTINLPLALDATRAVQVADKAFLTIGGAITGAFGLTKTGLGTLTLTGANTFSGPLAVNAGVVSVAADTALGAVPGVATPGQLVINNGSLRTTANFALNALRGITVGPPVGTGSGAIDVLTGTTVTYGGIISNNGAGIGGLTKTSFGGLTLSGANTYTGATTVKVGTLTLDFAQATSPVNNIISPSSPLTLGGSNAGLGGTSFAALTMAGGAIANTQSFNGTTIDIGPAIVRANSGAGGSATLNLGGLTHVKGGVVNFVRPTTGNITTTTPNTNGILGGWATVGTGATVSGTTMGNEWAAVDGSGNVVPYAGHLPYVTGVKFSALPGYTTASNLRINNASSGDIIVETPNANSVTDINTVQLSEATGRSLVVGAGNTLRLGQFGGIFRSDATAAGITWVIGTSTGGANGTQNEGTLTAGGAPDQPGELAFTINAPSQTAGSLNVETRVTDNGLGAVTVVKAGPGSMKFRGNNTYSGGTYILQGRFQLAGSEIGSANPDGWGTGPIFVMPGAQAFPSGAGTGPVLNDWFLAGNGISDNVGAIRLSSGGTLAGTMTLIGDTRLGGGGTGGAAGGGGIISGKITGGFNLDFGANGNSGAGHNVAIISNPLNDWTGNTTLVGRTGGSAGNTRLVLGANEVIPDGPGKGNVIIGNSGNTVSTTTLDLNGFNETINGLSSAGTVTLGFVQNNAAATASILSVGGYDQTSTFAGIIQDGPSGGTVALTKIGSGILTLSAGNTYSGETKVNAGTLSVTGVGAGLLSSGVVTVNTSAIEAGTLSGTAAIGNVTLGANTGAQIASIAPGATSALGAIGTLTLSSLTVNGGDLQFDLVAPGSSDFIDVTGTAAFNALATISPGPIGIAGTYTLLTAAGGLTLGVTPVVSAPANTRSTFTLDTATPNAIKLVVSGGAKTITWTGAVNNVWDVVSTTNWAEGATPEKFYTNDAVVFTNGPAIRNIDLGVSVLPGSITVNNSAGNDYTFAGGGSIDGSASLSKSGDGKLIVGVTNSYTGPTTINGGTVQVGNGGAAGSLGAGDVTNESILVFNRSDASTHANIIGGNGELQNIGTGRLTLAGANSYLGATSIKSGTVVVTNAAAGTSSLGGLPGGAVTIDAGAALDLTGSAVANALNFDTKQFNIQGTGVGGTGVITNSGTIGQQNALQRVTLTGNATVGGSGRFDIRAADSTLDLAGFTLTKTGPAQFTLVGTTVSEGNIVVDQGILAIETTASIPENGTGKSITYNTGTTAQFFNLGGQVFRRMVINGNVTMGNASAQLSTLNSNITLNGELTFTNLNNSTGALTLNGNLTEIGGSRSITKTGGSTVTLTGTNTYSGPTNINGGFIEFSSFSNLGTNPAINFAGGGLLYGFGAGSVDVSSRTLTFNPGGGVIDLSGNDVTFANSIGNNGAGGFTKAGVGVLTLTQPNTYSGPTTISGAGVLAFSALNQLGTGTAINFAAGGTLRYAPGNTVDVTARTVALNTGGGIIDTNGNNVTFANGLAGSGGLEKTGAGTITLNGNNTYTGATSVSAGTLLVKGSLNSSTAVNINGGILRLAASNVMSDTAPVTLLGGTLNTGGFSDTVGVMTLGGVAILDLANGASILNFADSSANTPVWIGSLSIRNWSGVPEGGGTDQIFFGSSDFGLTPEQLALISFFDPQGPGSGTFPALLLTSGELVAAVPEPGSLLGFVSGAALLLLRRRPAHKQR